jgi:hypothetical protein
MCAKGEAQSGTSEAGLFCFKKYIKEILSRSLFFSYHMVRFASIS